MSSDFGSDRTGDDLEQLCCDTIRVLAMDAVEKAGCGHPGMPMGAAEMGHVLWTQFLNLDPSDPGWIGRDRFIRNVLYAIGNSADASLIAPARALLDDPSPVVRDAAVWALSRLMAPADFAAIEAANCPISEAKSLSDPSPGLTNG